MISNYIEVSVRGTTTKVPFRTVRGRTVIAAGHFLKLAYVHDEEWLGGDVVDAPESFIREMRNNSLKIDIFTFTQKLTDTRRKYSYHTEWDNVAAIPVTTFKDWLEKRAEYDVRKAVKKANKLGVVVEAVAYTDEFVRGIQDIYNETPIRQGKPFWHYGKDFETVKKENSTYRERSEYIGAYYHGELIGFIRMVYVGKVARTLQVLSKSRHFDKRPSNALIAKAVELCEAKGMQLFVYDKYDFGNKGSSSFTEFKRRNGFEELRFPRYYVPLTFRGRFGLRMGLHRGIRHWIPGQVKDVLVRLRSKACAIGGARLSRARARQDGKTANVASGSTCANVRPT
jgi:hypothetical protein